MARASRARRGSSAASPAARRCTPPTRLAHDPKWAGKTIVVVLPDAGERYLTGALFEGMFDEIVAKAS
jgi:cysteine synthase A